MNESKGYDAIVISSDNLHAIIFLFSTGINGLSISAMQVIRGDYYRIISSAFVHGGVLHIFMNMSSLLQLGGSLESQFGSMQFAFFTMWSVLLSGGLYVLLSWCVIS